MVQDNAHGASGNGEHGDEHAGPLLEVMLLKLLHAGCTKITRTSAVVAAIFTAPAGQLPENITRPFLGGRFGYFFFCSGERKGESEAPGGGRGNDFLLKIPGGGVSWPGGGGGARGWQGACGEFGGGGGAKYFFWGRNSPQVLRPQDSVSSKRCSRKRCLQ